MSPRPFSWLPDLLGEIAEVAGLEAALAVARAAGGRRVTIPARAKDGGWLVDAVGREAADKICDHFRTLDAEGNERGSGKLVIPLGPQSHEKTARRQLRDKLQAGVSPRRAAWETGLHERTAWKTKARMREAATPDPSRPTLFEAGLEEPSKTPRKSTRG